MKAFTPPITQRRLYEKALLIREVEQTLLDLFSAGKLFGTVHTCIGQEWTGVAVAAALREDDFVFSNHRCHGHFLARTNDVDGLVAEIMGKQSGVCGGRGGSQHLCQGHFFSNGVQGGIVPVSAGLAWACKRAEADRIACVFLGDGTLGEGVVYETLNIASKWRLPLLFVLENNRYAQSTSQDETLAGSIMARAEAFGIRWLQADTWRPEQLTATASEAVEYVRNDTRPLFLQIDTYRLMAHSKGDDDRDLAEVEEYRRRDPLVLFSERHESEAEEMLRKARRRVEEAVARADAEPYCRVGDGESTVKASSANKSPLVWRDTHIEGRERVAARIHAALQAALAHDERIVIFGEDVEGPYGGAFKVTKNLSQEFPGRVRNCPISEAAIVGMAGGLALAGMIPVCEIMFGDFLCLAADQFINHAAKFRYMYNNQVTVPLVVRTPMGGRRGYGPTHSQSLEKHFLGAPGTQVLAIHHRFDPAVVYQRLLESIDCPTLVVENKLLYAQRVSSAAPDGFQWRHTDELFPTSQLCPQGQADVTVLCYGGTLPEVEAAVETLFDEHEIICEALCPTRLYPLDMRPVLESVAKTGRLVIVEEGQAFAAFGAEVLAQISECGGGVKRAKRISAAAHAIPSCQPAELQALPGRGHVVDGVVEVMSNE